MKETSLKGYILDDSIYRTFLKREHQIDEDRLVVVRDWGYRESVTIKKWQDKEVLGGSQETALCLYCGRGYTTLYLYKIHSYIPKKDKLTHNNFKE